MAEELQGLQFLVKAPSKNAVDQLLTAVFQKRTGGLSDDEKKQICTALQLSRADVDKLLNSIRLLIRASMRKNVSKEQLIAAFPSSVDSRLRDLLFKLLEVRVPQWKEELQTPKTTPEPLSESAPKSLKPGTEQKKDSKEDASVSPDSATLPKKVQDQDPSVQPRQSQKTNKSSVAPSASATESRKPNASQLQVSPGLAAKVDTRHPGMLQPALPRLLDFDWRTDIRSSSESVEHMFVPTVLVQLKVEGQISRVGEKPPPRVVTFELSKEALGLMLEGLRFVKEQLSGISGN